MRHLILIPAFALFGSSAMAGSVDVVGAGTMTSAGSVLTETCTTCPALKEDIRKKDYTVPTLKEGTQTVEIRNIDGENKLVRTEAWMGGSPVVFVSKAPPETALASAPDATGPAEGIDTSATAAISSTVQPIESALTDRADVGKMEPMRPLDISNFNMRM